MVTVSRRVLLPFLEPSLAPAVCCALAPNPIQADETPAILSPTEHRSSPITYPYNLEHRLTKHFAKKYLAYDFSPYAQELGRIRGAVNLMTRWGAKREMGIFRTMPATRPVTGWRVRGRLQ